MSAEPSLTQPLKHDRKPGAPPMLVLDIELIETALTVPSSPSPATPSPAAVVFLLDPTQDPDSEALGANASEVIHAASGHPSTSGTAEALGSRLETDMTESTSREPLPQDNAMRTPATPTIPSAVTGAGAGTKTPTSPTAAPATQTGSGPWPEHPRQFLERVKETVSKAELGNLLSKGSDPFHQAVLRIHMESFDFRRDPIDLALRKFLLDFHFPKEAQQIDRVLEAFASRYHTCNPQLFRSSDVVYTIAFSLMLLHTDAHNKNVRYKMTKEQYVRQAKTIDGVNTIPADVLEVLYDNITFLKFVYAEDDMDVDGQRIAEVQPATSGSWFPRRRTASTQRTDSYSMIRHGSISHLAPDLSDLIPFRWPYYWKGTIEMVDNVQINNQFTRAPLVSVPGLRLRLHGQQQQHIGSGLGGNPPPLSSRSTVRPELMSNIDGDLKGEGDLQRENATQWSGSTKEDDEAEGCAQLRIVKCGVLSRKIDVEHGKKSSVRGWRDLGIILSGSQLLFFTDTAWFQQQRASQIGFNPQAPPEVDGYFATDLNGGSLPPMPQALISTLDSIAVVDSSYQKYPHVFRLVCPNGKQYLFRSDSEHEMNDWMAKINYASAFKTAGVRLRNYRVSWAKDVVWIKDDQGRHQLRRKRPDVPTTPEPLDGRAQLIQAKMKDIDRQINTCSASLAAELRLARGLEVMIPLQSSTRQKIVQSATVVGKRLRHLMLERTKLDCFRTILERDLAVIPAGDFSHEESHANPEHGFGLHVSDGMSGTTEYSRTSLGSRTVRTQSEMPAAEQGDFDHPLTLNQHQQQQTSWNRSVLGMGDHLDHLKEGEYVLDSSRTSQSSTRSYKGSGGSSNYGGARPRLNIPEFHRSVSENTLDERSRCSIKDADIPAGPMAIQAAIIDAARGHHHGGHGSSNNGNNNNNSNSTMSSPDLNHYQVNGNGNGSHLSPMGHPSPKKSPQASHPPSSPSSSLGQSLLSPESPTSQIKSRSRALSMPGQRPNMMPRTVSIYSSSSQTASRLRRIFEQGLVHFKFNQSSAVAAAAGAGGLGSATSSASSTAPNGSSLKTSTSFQVDMKMDLDEISHAVASSSPGRDITKIKR